MRDLNDLNRHRQAKVELDFWGHIGDSGNGFFAFKSPVDDKVLRVIASTGFGWDHVSVSKQSKIPNWTEMEFVKRRFFKPDEIAIQFHVPEDEHITYHNFCLHIWRPLGFEIPLPPTWMIANQKERRDRNER